MDHEKRQQKKFFKRVVNDKNCYCEERKIEKKIAKNILSTCQEDRDKVYRESYEQLHRFFLDASQNGILYKDIDLQRALWKQKLLSQKMGKNQRILEVGCGEGILSIAISKAKNKVTGIDVSDTSIILSNKNKKNFDAKNVAFLRMNGVFLDFPDKTFDSMVSTDVIEHLHPNDVQTHLLEAFRVLKKNGKYIIITPNSKFGKHAGASHLKEYSIEELTNLLVQAGFTIKIPLFNYVLPLNLLVNTRVKLNLEKIPLIHRLFNIIWGFDPIVIIAIKC